MTTIEPLLSPALVAEIPEAPWQQMVFDLAIGVLHRTGWTQGVTVDAEGRHCGWGAVDVAYREIRAGRWDIKEQSDLMAEMTMWAQRQGNYPGFVDWNDTPGRTADEVVAAFKLIGEEFGMKAGRR